MYDILKKEEIQQIIDLSAEFSISFKMMDLEKFEFWKALSDDKKNVLNAWYRRRRSKVGKCSKMKKDLPPLKESKVLGKRFLQGFINVAQCGNELANELVESWEEHITSDLY